jgi:hypothetical protein
MVILTMSERLLHGFVQGIAGDLSVRFNPYGLCVFILRPDPKNGIVRYLPEITIRVGEVS